MVKAIHVCCGNRVNPHPAEVMRVDKNGVDIFRFRMATSVTEKGDLVLTEGYGWKELADKFGVKTFSDLEKALFRAGGDYYGSSDRLVCPTCGSTICWRE